MIPVAKPLRIGDPFLSEDHRSKECGRNGRDLLEVHLIYINGSGNHGPPQRAPAPGVYASGISAVPQDPRPLIERYHRDHPGKGKWGQLWQPIPIQRYWDPKDLYRPPKTVPLEVTRKPCLQCHRGLTPGIVAAWEKSVHARLDEIRPLPPISNPHAQIGAAKRWGLEGGRRYLPVKVPGGIVLFRTGEAGGRREPPLLFRLLPFLPPERPPLPLLFETEDHTLRLYRLP